MRGHFAPATHARTEHDPRRTFAIGDVLVWMIDPEMHDVKSASDVAVLALD